MKKLLIVILIASPLSIMAQKYYCPVSRADDGTTMKVEMWAEVGDSAVVLKSEYQDKINSVTNKRVPNSNPSIVYFTDGVTTSTLTIMEINGTAKGFKYSHTAILSKQNYTSSLMMYCTIIPGK